MYASDAEIIHALAAVEQHRGYYCPHHRNYGADVIAGYQACLDIAAAANVPLHLAHCHVNYPQNKGRAGEVLTAIDLAVDAGLDVTLDSYPSLAGATYLSSLMPSWAHQEGPAGVARLLNQAESREEILREIEIEGSDGNHGVPMDWTSIVVSSVRRSNNSWAVGASIADRRAVGAGPRGCVLRTAHRPALRLGLTDRGAVDEHYWADTLAVAFS